MYGQTELKKSINAKDRGYVCPVAGCQTRIPEKQSKSFLSDPKFSCPIHNIIFSPSTFEYANPALNILWGDYTELQALTSKRESRIQRDNSEDAVTWNAFRFMETNGLLLQYLAKFADAPSQLAEVIYWSHDRQTGKLWEPLRMARREFENDEAHGSEPDIIIRTDRCLFIIEAKLTATNKTKPSHSNFPKNYVTGANGWWHHVFAPDADYINIAEVEKKYELMRFWILGTWMAQQLNVDFRLINLVRTDDEQGIEKQFRRFLPSAQSGKFLRSTWEDIYKFTKETAPDTADKKTLMEYFAQKTVGYDGDGNLRKAFVTDATLSAGG